MLRRISSRLTYANVAATLALVFAMSGGAYAASKYVITSTKQIKPSVLKTLKAPGKAGATGKNGTNGTNGSPGTNGTAGTNGTNGTAGTNGTSVTSKEQKTGAIGTCADGGSEFVSASGKTYACNGTSGFTAVLPAGETEKGTWSAETPEGSSQPGIASISFSIPLAAPLDSGHVFYVPPSGSVPECPGSVAAPEAEEGDLCVYTTFNSLKPDEAGVIHAPQGGISETLGETGAGESGAVLLFQPEGTPAEGGFAIGTWAVKAG